MKRPTYADRIEAWQQFPLCTKYLLTQFQSIDLRAEQPTPSVERAQWVLGVTSAGERDVLGLWTGQATPWEQVIDELVTRGVERIRFIVSAEGGLEHGSARLQATVSTSCESLVQDPRVDAACSQRARRLVNAAGESSRHLQARLSAWSRTSRGQSVRQGSIDHIARELFRWEREQ